ncbi:MULTISPECIES: PhoH family protein [Burkholderia]|uniref:PhoH-like protein n=1 Tax=Burkholderia sp. M701 TaxID=326454 RepID=V5YNR8_9BURK|nr:MULTISPECIES: PhoH family protein [Burkholderia]BAO19240.1 PhoH-like protein [Burkholderia sp. M701]
MANSSRGAAKTAGTGNARARKSAATAEKSKGKTARAREKEPDVAAKGVIGTTLKTGVQGGKAQKSEGTVAHRKRKAPAAAPQVAKPKTKIFVLDTNVLMHDPVSVFRFEEHDVFVPMMTLEELDNNKKGMTDAARNARMVSRLFDEIIQTHDNGIADGIALITPSAGIASGRLFFQCDAIDYKLPDAMPSGKGDNQILAVVLHLKHKYPSREVILVSKDINIRIKAKTLGIEAEDYLSDQVIEDSSLLPTGVHTFDSDFWDGVPISSRHNHGVTEYRVESPKCEKLAPNEFVVIEESALVARVIEAGRSVAKLHTVTDYTSGKKTVCGISARNNEQNFALNLLMDKEVDFITLLGQAGTGKTLLAMAAAIQQTAYDSRYAEIIVTRATVPIGDEIGFLPGNEAEKMEPWMGAIEDNIEVLSGSKPGLEKPNEMGKIRSKIKLKSMSFMRGRTFLNKFLIIDEAQNLTPKQMKALITRAGPGTKIVCLGNIAQIDTPYLTEGSSGLTYVVEKFREWNHSGHLTLMNCERSRLADFAGEAL